MAKKAEAKAAEEAERMEQAFETYQFAKRHGRTGGVGNRQYIPNVSDSAPTAAPATADDPINDALDHVEMMQTQKEQRAGVKAKRQHQ